MVSLGFRKNKKQKTRKEDEEMSFSNFSMVVRNLCQSGHMIVQREANEPKAKFTLRNQSFGGNLGFMGRDS